MRVIPTVTRIMHYFPGQHDTFMTRRNGSTRPATEPLPLAALVVDVISDALVNVTVFDAFGKPHSRVHVSVVDEVNPYTVERCGEGYVAWPVIVRPAENVGRGNVGVARGADQARQATGLNPNYRSPNVANVPQESPPGSGEPNDPPQLGAFDRGGGERAG